MQGCKRHHLLTGAALGVLSGALWAASACGPLAPLSPAVLPSDANQGVYLREVYADADIASPITVTYARRMPRCIEVMGADGVPFTACQYSSSKSKDKEQASPDKALLLKMDIYRAPDAQVGPPRAAVLWLHGGMFVRNGRNSADSPQRGRDFAKAGYVVAVPNYRLTPFNNIWPDGSLSPDAVRQGALDDAAEDARNALRYLRAHATSLNIDPTRIAVVGDTAGGALALINAAKADGLDDDVADGPDYPGICGRPDAAISTGATLFDRGQTPSGSFFDAGDSPVQLFHARVDPHTGATWDGEVAASCELFINGGGTCERVQHLTNTHSVVLNLSGPYAPDLRGFLWRQLRLTELLPYATPTP